MKKTFSLAFLLLLTAIPAGAGEILIPAVYRGTGAHDTNWRTEIVVSNVGPLLQLEPVPVTITFHGADGTTKSVSMPFTRYEVIAIPDAVHDWFDLESGSGIVRVTWPDSGARIAARARIYNVGSSGEYGQSVPGVETSKLASENFLPGLTGIGGNRTNVGVSNPTTTDSIIWVELIDTSGSSRGAFATVVRARSYVQFNDIFAHFQAGPLNAAMVRVHSTQSIIYAYASIVRNDTGDATFVVNP
jgi:hypothetical protein